MGNWRKEEHAKEKAHLSKSPLTLEKSVIYLTFPAQTPFTGKLYGALWCPTLPRTRREPPCQGGTSYGLLCSTSHSTGQKAPF